jgi:tetratricopeptide (TPR) repeat protein
LSYDLLTPELQKLWRALAVFPETFDRAAATAVWAMEADPAQDALSELVKFSLLDYSPHSLPDFSAHPTSVSPKQMDQGLPSLIGGFSDGAQAGAGDGGAPGRYHLHDLARLYADTHLSEPERYEAQKRHAAYYLSVTWKTDGLYKQGGESLKRGLALFDLEWKNIQAGQKWAQVYADKDDVAALLCSNYPIAGAYLLDLRQLPREHIHWLEAALTASRHLENRAAEGSHLGNLGIVYWRLGKPHKAIEYDEQALVIAREIGERHSEGAALGNLGLAYLALGETYKAIEYHEQHLVIAREIGDRRNEGQALGNLGSAYFTLGETLKAIEFYKQRLVIAREISDRRSEGEALQGLVISYGKLGKTRRALELCELQWIIVREIGDRSGEGNVLFNMSLLLDKLGERTQAIARAEVALKICEEIEDPRAVIARKQLENWHKWASKKWWQFWK